MIVESRLYEKINGKIQCKTCAHYCKLKSGGRGICRVRKNTDGKLMVENYALVSSIYPDPIEKKPLYHFKPGTRVLSLGGVSCNFRCDHCQNYSISFADTDFHGIREIPPETAVNMIGEYGCSGIAFTYNEPSIWHEYAEDCMKPAKKSGYYTVYVTNGYLSEESINTISSILDASNVDVKAFNEKFYREICGGKLEKVLEAVEIMHRKGIFLELTYLVIPGKNDSPEEIREFARWVAGIDPSIPVHFSRFHPDYKLMDVPPTPIQTLEQAHDIAKEEGIDYVYLGNVYGHRYEKTYCRNCGEMVIERRGFDVVANLLKGDRCPFCGEKNNVVP